MSILVIGGDHLGRIPDFLQERGFTDIRHITGRKSNSIGNLFLSGADMVLVLTDYVGTDLSRTIKKESKKKDVKVIFSRRSWSAISRELDRVSFGLKFA